MTSWRLADTLPVDLDVFPDIVRHLQLDRNEWSEQTTITVLSKYELTVKNVNISCFNKK